MWEGEVENRVTLFTQLINKPKEKNVERLEDKIRGYIGVNISLFILQLKQRKVEEQPNRKILLRPGPKFSIFSLIQSYSCNIWVFRVPSFFLPFSLSFIELKIESFKWVVNVGFLYARFFTKTLTWLDSLDRMEPNFTELIFIGQI